MHSSSFKGFLFGGEGWGEGGVRGNILFSFKPAQRSTNKTSHSETKESQRMANMKRANTIPLCLEKHITDAFTESLQHPESPTNLSVTHYWCLETRHSLKAVTLAGCRFGVVSVFPVQDLVTCTLSHHPLWRPCSSAAAEQSCWQSSWLLSPPLQQRLYLTGRRTTSTRGGPDTAVTGHIFHHISLKRITQG